MKSLNNFQNALPSDLELCTHKRTNILHFIFHVQSENAIARPRRLGYVYADLLLKNTRTKWDGQCLEIVKLSLLKRNTEHSWQIKQHIFRKTIEGYLDSATSLTVNTIKKLILHAFYSSSYLQSKWVTLHGLNTVHIQMVQPSILKIHTEISKWLKTIFIVCIP